MERRPGRWQPGNGQLDVPAAEARLTALLETCQDAVEELACHKPARHGEMVLLATGCWPAGSAGGAG